MSLQSIHFEETSGQYTKIVNADQTGLGLNTLTSFRINVFSKLESLPSTGGTYFGLCGKYDSASGQRGWTFDIRNDDTLGFLYSETAGGGGYNWKISSSAVVTSTDLSKWIKFTAEVTPGTGTIVLKKDDVTLAQSSVLSGGTSIATTTADFTIGKGNGAPTADQSVSLVEIWDTSGGADSLVDSWEFQGNTDSTSGLNDLTALNSPTFVNDNPLTDISLYDQVQDTDWFEIEAQATQVDDDLTDYPYYFDLSILPASFWSGVSTDGSDIRVFDSTGVEQKSLEVVGIDTVGETGEIHFKDDTDSTTNKNYRVYINGASAKRDSNALYGSQNVWTDYVSVFHNQGDGSGDATDSTSNGNDLTAVSAPPTATGQIGDGRDYDGSADYHDLTTSSDNSSPAVTLQSWIKPDSVTGAQSICYIGAGNGVSSGNEQGILMVGDKPWALTQQAGSSSQAQSTTALSTGNWYMLHGVFSTTSSRKIYLDGSLEVENTATRSGSGSGIRIAQRFSADQKFDGVIDETRIRKSTLSDNWISTEYNNQNEPASFWTYNTGAAPAITSNAILFACNF